ncbi:hypothetical protein G1C95_0309 [Bifidobacterium sp. DSM 109957]|uniref:DUF2442 domain-containing protein n=2 Tax=Bifidobacterium oedipodis TaxID=2675322 RepID=A0A7Y0HSZ7_9BIFI|nr:hypothetical protein [Bifidobacterium sp. DSM 109957]
MSVSGNELGVTSAVAVNATHVALRFSNGHCGVLDMLPFVKMRSDGLRDPKVFLTARAGVNTVEWNNGLIDIEPETAYSHMVLYSA